MLTNDPAKPPAINAKPKNRNNRAFHTRLLPLYTYASPCNLDLSIKFILRERCCKRRCYSCIYPGPSYTYTIMPSVARMPDTQSSNPIYALAFWLCEDITCASMNTHQPKANCKTIPWGYTQGGLRQWRNVYQYSWRVDPNLASFMRQSTERVGYNEYWSRFFVVEARHVGWCWPVFMCERATTASNKGRRTSC